MERQRWFPASFSRFAWARLASRALIVVLTLLGGVSLAAGSAHAHSAETNDGGYAITLALQNGPTFYDNVGSSPAFAGIVTVPAGVKISSGQAVINITGCSTHYGGGNYHQLSATTYSYVAYTSWQWCFPVGNLSAVATFQQMPSGTAVAMSKTIPIVIQRTPTSLGCSVGDAGYVYGAGQTLHIAMQPVDANGQPDVDWQHGTYSVSFTGPTTTTFSDLTPDGNDAVAVPAPAQIGQYTLACKFNGTTEFAPSTVGTAPITISLERALAGAQLRTNPTTLQPNERWQVYVVLQAPAGAPTPTGTFSVLVDHCGSPWIAVAASGATIATVGPIASTCSLAHVEIIYHGDSYYNGAVFTFPRTNPAIDSTSAQATATPSANPIPSASATPPGADPVGTVNTTSGQGGSPLLPLLAILAVLLGGGAGTLFLLARRAKP